jgi:hypothetical protein
MKKKTYLKPESEVLVFELDERLMFGGQTSIEFKPKEEQPGVVYPDV